DNGSSSPLTDDGRLREDQAEFDDLVLFALRQLSDLARTCLLLRVVGHYSYDEIAQTLRIPEGTAMSHVHRAKKSIRRRLMAHGQHTSDFSCHQRNAQ